MPGKNCLQFQLKLKTRYVDDLGETLIVRDRNGKKVLTDAIDETMAVLVPAGRDAVLVCLTFFGVPAGSSSRDSDVIVTNNSRDIGFISVDYPKLCVFLQDLPEGQVVDILPIADPAVAYAVIPLPAPVLCGAIATQPLYAAAAA